MWGSCGDSRGGPVPKGEGGGREIQRYDNFAAEEEICLATDMGRNPRGRIVVEKRPKSHWITWEAEARQRLG